MKVYELRPGTFLEQTVTGRNVYYLFEGCDGSYGKFIEVNRNGDAPGEPVYDKYNPVFYSCWANLEELNLKILLMPNVSILESIKEFFKDIKTLIKK